jgi:hypothetical protein
MKEQNENNLIIFSNVKAIKNRSNNTSYFMNNSKLNLINNLRYIKKLIDENIYRIKNK